MSMHEYQRAHSQQSMILTLRICTLSMGTNDFSGILTAWSLKVFLKSLLKIDVRSPL